VSLGEVCRHEQEEEKHHYTKTASNFPTEAATLLSLNRVDQNHCEIQT
jgi:hypothetical protein